MLKRVVITNYLGEQMEYKIDGVQVDNPAGLIITEIDGLGPVKADINMTDLTTSDGGLFNSARLQKRNIVITASFTNVLSVEEARLLSYKYFPIKRPLTFLIETDNRKAKTVGYVESNEPDIFSEKSTCKISIVCESPYFEATDKTTYARFSDVIPSFRFKYKNEGLEPNTIFGVISHKDRQKMTYIGDCDTGLVMNIECTGDITELEILDLSTGKSMVLDVSKLVACLPSGAENNNKLINGDIVTIVTYQKKKTITLKRGSGRYNILNLLGKNPHWFTLTRGENEFMYISNNSELIKMTIEAPVLYEGV